jgi:fatty acid synthase subunit alpha
VYVYCTHCSTESLHALVTRLHRTESVKTAALEQSRVPYSKRKKEFSAKYLRASVPFHSQHLTSAVKLLTNDMKTLGIEFSAKNLVVPVYSTLNGEDLRAHSNLTETLIQLQCTAHVDWTAVLKNVIGKVTHVIDWGPGLESGIGNTTQRELEGYGIQIVLAGAVQSRNRALADKSVLFDCRSHCIPTAVNWGSQYAPKLIKRKSDGKIFIDTKFTRAVGKPPLMLAGMTPTTVSTRLVAAVYNAGYHAELAGGGLPSEQLFKGAIEELLQQVNTGLGITVNVLFLNPRLWSFQFPLIEKLKMVLTALFTDMY